MPYIRANGIRIAFDTFGSMNQKPLFLIHGLTGQRMSMNDLARRLADAYFIITYDCRGHGQTDHPAAYTLADHGQDLLALIDALGYEKASVLGQSMGSYIALQAAEMAPERIETLILITPKAFDDGSGSSYQRLLKEEGLDMSKSSPEQRARVLNKALWSPSFTLVAGGISFIAFAAFYWVVDVLGWRRWALPFAVVGMNSITIYMAQRVIGFRRARDFLFGGIASLFPGEWENVALQVGYVAVCWLFLYFLHRKGVYLKV